MQWKPSKENLQAIEASVVAYCGRMKTVSKEALQDLTAVRDYLAKFERDASTAQPMRRKPYSNIVQAGTLTIPQPYQNEENVKADQKSQGNKTYGFFLLMHSD
jgi:hypothetical protein